MPFYHENENESELVADSTNIEDRARFLSDGTVLNEYQLRGDGGCGVYGEGSYPPFAIKELKNWINIYPILKNIILENMLDDFWHITGEMPACQRFYSVDKNSYHYAYNLAYQNNNPVAKQEIAKEFCKNRISKYLDEYAKNILSGNPLWFLDLPQSLLNEKEGLRLINAIAYLQGLKLEIYQANEPTIPLYIFSTANTIAIELCSYIYDQENEGLFYFDANGDYIAISLENQDNRQQAFNEYCTYIRGSTPPLVDDLVLTALTATQVNYFFSSPPDFLPDYRYSSELNLIHIYEPETYTARPENEKESATTRLTHWVNHFNLLVPANDPIANKKAALQEAFFIEHEGRALPTPKSFTPYITLPIDKPIQPPPITNQKIVFKPTLSIKPEQLLKPLESISAVKPEQPKQTVQDIDRKKLELSKLKQDLIAGFSKHNFKAIVALLKDKNCNVSLLSDTNKFEFYNVIQFCKVKRECEPFTISNFYADLLKSGIGIQGTDKRGWTALQLAAQNGNYTAIKILMITKIADLTRTTPDQKTLLHLISMNNKLQFHEARELLQELVMKGVNINATDDKGLSVLHYAALAKYYDRLRFLINNKAKITLAPNRQTLLHLIATQVKPNDSYFQAKPDNKEIREIIDYLSKMQIDINAVNSMGFTALHLAARSAKYMTIKILMTNKEIDLTKKTAGNETLIHLISINTELNSREVKLLLNWCCDNSIDINAVNTANNTALHFAAANDRLHAVKWLVSKNPELINATNNLGQTALYLAEEKDHVSITDYFKNSASTVAGKRKNNPNDEVNNPHKKVALPALQHIKTPAMLTEKSRLFNDHLQTAQYIKPANPNFSNNFDFKN